MTRPDLDELRALADFADVYRWNLTFAKFPAQGTYPTSDLLNLLCISTDIPKLDTPTSEVTIRGNKVSHPGIANYAGTITLRWVH